MTIIKDEKLLQINSDITFIPELILEREYITQLDDLFRFNNIKYVVGHPGSGKSTMIKAFIKKHENIENIFIYIECKSILNEKSLANYLFEQLVLKFPDCQFNYGYAGLGKIGDSIMKINQQYKGYRLFIILDEIDIFMKNTKREDKDFLLHFFGRLATESNPHDVLKFLFITNHLTILSKCSVQVQQVWVGSMVNVPCYSMNELKEILSLRAKLALKEGTYDDNILFYLSKVCTQIYNQSARDLVKLLFLSSKKAKDFLTKEFVDEASLELQKEFINNIVNNFPLSDKICLKAISNYALIHSTRFFTTGNIKEEFITLCQECALGLNNIDTRIASHFKNLKETNIIIHTGDFQGKYGVYELTVTPQEILQALSN